MQLIVTGASGFLATEVIRQSLCLPKITSVIALARRTVTAPSDLATGADPSKLRSVVIKDYNEYPEDVREQFATADACIWTVAVTPSKSRAMHFSGVRRICHNYTFIGLKAMTEARGNAAKPLRFIYLSGAAAERDDTKSPRFMPQYSLMRGETENKVLELAAEDNAQIEACVAKSGLITSQGDYFRLALATVMNFVGIVPNVAVTELAAALLDQVINGFEKDTLENEDLVRIGRASAQK